MAKVLLVSRERGHRFLLFLIFLKRKFIASRKNKNNFLLKEPQALTRRSPTFLVPGTGFVRDNRGFLGGSVGKEPACQWRRHTETLVQSLGQEDPLEEGIATHSSILSWKIPWMGEPGGLQSMGWPRVGHN